MIPENTENIWQEVILPEIEKFKERPIPQSALITLKMKGMIDEISLPSTVINRLNFDTNRLVKICNKKDPFLFPHPGRLITDWYPFSTRYITLAERNLKIPNFALLYAEEVPGLMKNKLSAKQKTRYQKELDELSDLLIKDSTGFLLIDDMVNYCAHTKSLQDKSIPGNIIKQIIAQGAERYKFIYNQLLLPQTDQIKNDH